MQDKNKKGLALSLSKGFTLIEMLVVVLIIGILATIVVVSVAGGRKKALATKAKTAMTGLNDAIEMAASEGCKKFDLTNGQLLCDGSATKIYADVGIPPSGMQYVVGGKSAADAAVSARCDAASGTCTWTNIDAAVVSKGYYFYVDGFSNGENFECSDGMLTNRTAAKPSCSCSVQDGCAESK